MGWIFLFAMTSLVAGFLAAFLFLLFLSVGTGFSEPGTGWLLLLGTLCSLWLFSWQMLIRERFRRMSNRPGHIGSFRAKIEGEKKRSEDPFYEPSPFPWREGRRKPVIDPSWGVDIPPETREGLPD